MSDFKNVKPGGNKVNDLTGKQVGGREAPPVGKEGTPKDKTRFSAGQLIDARRSVEDKRLPQSQKVLNAAADGRGSPPPTEAAKHINLLGGVSATDRLLGLDLRPTITGVLAPPPGNSEFLRHVSPQMRRTIMRKMLNKQRERMRRLASFLRDRRDESDGGNIAEDRESFLEVIAEKMRLEEYNADKNQILRAAGELDKTARMLDVLDEMLAMQDYTISRIGTFTKG